MNWQDEIRLLGQPIKLTLPGEANERYKSAYGLNKDVELIAGKTYDGFDINEDLLFYRLQNIYLVEPITGKLVDLSSFSIPNIHNAIRNTMILVQREFCADNLYKVLNMFNKKINEIDQRLCEKADRE